MDTTLTSRHALVTGGGTGIGLSIAKSLASAGAQVTITGRRAEVLEAAAAKTPGLHPCPLDVTDEAATETAFDAAATALGPIAITVANAGIAEGGAIAKTPLADWRRIQATNLDGAFLTIRAALTRRDREDWGRVIAVSSVAGIKGHKGAAAYTASKHGLIGLIRGLAADHLGAPITFNALCPAYVETDIIPQNIDRIMARTGMDEAAAREVMVGANPHGRLIAPDEIGAAALWLCSDGAASINGQALQIAGGEF